MQVSSATVCADTTERRLKNLLSMRAPTRETAKQQSSPGSEAFYMFSVILPFSII